MTTKRAGLQARNTLTVKLTKTDQQAVEILKLAFRTVTTSDTVREAMKLALSTVSQVMKDKKMTNFTELYEFLDNARATAPATPAIEVPSDGKANPPGTEVPSSP